MKLLVATNNRGKLVEYRHLLDGLPLEITSLGEEKIEFEPQEAGSTFEENAILKASAFAMRSELLTLADDSGLEIDALSGAPGVHSARYGATRRGQPAPAVPIPETGTGSGTPRGPGDVQRYELVLRQMDGVPWAKRTARFRCVLALATPDGHVETAEGVIEGIIAFEPQGEHGFGYDPIFFIPEFDCTMAQLPPETKNQVSHRARAARAALPIIRRLASRLPQPEVDAPAQGSQGCRHGSSPSATE